MLAEIQTDARTRMNKSLEALRHELAKIRTGRAHPSLLEHVHVDYYGSEVRGRAFESSALVLDSFFGIFKDAETSS